MLREDGIGRGKRAQTQPSCAGARNAYCHLVNLRQTKVECAPPVQGRAVSAPTVLKIPSTPSLVTAAALVLLCETFKRLQADVI